MPRHPEDFLPRPFEQGVVDRDRERSADREQSAIRSANANPTVSLDQRVTAKDRCARM